MCQQIVNDLGRCGVVSATYDALYSTVCDNTLDGFVRHTSVVIETPLCMYVSITEWILAWCRMVYVVYYSSSSDWYYNL